MRQMAEQAERAQSLEELLGIEGNAARIYFGEFAGMIKTEEDDTAAVEQFRFGFCRPEPPAAAGCGQCALIAGV
jgi:CRISPR-associated protein Cas1